MPQVVKYKNINFQKWEECVAKTPHQMIYAASWYLDIVTNHKWDALIWGDYEAVMPLPWNKKLLKKQIYIPNGVQQLGPFGNLDLVNQDEVIELIEKKYFQYSLATRMKLNGNSVQKMNLILSLQGDYKTTIYSNYKKNRKYDSRKKERFEVKEISVEEFLSFYIEEANEYITEPIPILNERVEKLSTTHQFITKGCYYQKELLSVVGLTNYFNRLTLLFSATNEKGYSENANPVLLDHFFKTYSQQDFIFDFEGSSISGIQKYFKSFGATNAPYFVTQKQNEIYKLLKK